ncbi:MAG: hypothetical protein R3D33_17120 [Hyphomicrobiaceae bacterium]
MRRFLGLPWSEVALATVFVLGATILVRPALSGEVAATGWTTAVEIPPDPPTGRGGTPSPASRGSADMKAMLTGDDHVAALEAIQYALDEVGDGATYFWHRKVGMLHGSVKPTSSFIDPDGRVCRHIELSMSFGTLSRETEGIACRDASRRWSLSG